ncbi:glycoside hydrolase superfamily [Chytriomyces sp. MP71]|nr:glycoside hydrolase superfamily [Chytriomyces sp. MP71]
MFSFILVLVIENLIRVAAYATDPQLLSLNRTTRPMLRKQLMGYYGQNAIANGVDLIRGRNSRPNNDWTKYQGTLRTYCDTGYYETINLAFLNLFGGGQNHFQITFGGFNASNYGGVYIYKGDVMESNLDNVVAGFKNMGQHISYCQTMKKVKIVLSLGGDRVSNYSLSPGDGHRYAKLFTEMFMDNGIGFVRPFGKDVKLDGVELDIEKLDNASLWTSELIQFVTTFRKLNPDALIAAVPQCYLNGSLNKDINLGDVISAIGDQLDYIIVQYYNNPTCSYPFDFNYNAWKALYNGPIVVGLAGDWSSAISGGFLEPGPLQAVYDEIMRDPQFFGFSVYDVSSSNPPARAWSITSYANAPVSHYSRTLRKVLDGDRQGNGVDTTPGGTFETLSHRCGGSWTYANVNCSLPACDSVLQNCENENWTCFSFLQNECAL